MPMIFRPHACCPLRAIQTGLSFVVGGLLVATGQAQPAGSNTATNRVDTKVLTVEGRVEAARAPGLWLKAYTNMVLVLGDYFRTGIRSRSMLRLSNYSLMRVNQLTFFEIQPPEEMGSRAKLKANKCEIYFFSRDGTREVEVETPTTSAAIRGTEFHLFVGDDGTTVLTLLEGEVDLQNQFGRLRLQSGEQGTVNPGQAPVKTAMIDAINIIQWCLYYPGIIDLDELNLPAIVQQDLAASLAMYRSGDLLQALALYPENRVPVDDSERIYRAAIFLAVGQVAEAETELTAVAAANPLAVSLRQMIAAVKFKPWPGAANPATASGWMAESYYQQSRSELEKARLAAKEVVTRSPNFGFGWARLAELEFSFGRLKQAREALEKALNLSPRNAQALALRGFILAAEHRYAEAMESFDQAIAVDGALGNAWLGRGLLKIYRGQVEEGREDLQVAATLEPHRALLRSYLAKSYQGERDARRAEKELAYAMQLDARDPTAWLYSALFAQQGNEINRGVRDLEQSQQLNDNRRVYRSRLLLDQDRAVRSANLAAIYQDAGLPEVAVREASKAVSADYANHSAHLFLANSYESLLDPKEINLRYDTAWLNELLLANLLAPPGGGSLSRYVSQQEYSRFFEQRRLGLSSSTEYLSRGAWMQKGSQFGVLGGTSYALDTKHTWDPGQRPNNDYEETYWSGTFKQQLSPQDTLFLQANYKEGSKGDVFQYYDPSQAQLTQRIDESRPEFYLGYHRQWSPGSHTLLLASRLEEDFNLTDPRAVFLELGTTNNAAGIAVPRRAGTRLYDQRRSENYEVYSLELQQILQSPRNSLIGGLRLQTGNSENVDDFLQFVPRTVFEGVLTTFYPARVTLADVRSERFSVYAYDSYRLVDSLQLSAGLAFDWLSHPLNAALAPLDSRTTHKSQVSPKAGLIWTPSSRVTARAGYARILGGFNFDSSLRLEPTQVAGFNQAFRSLVPESAASLLSGAEFDMLSAAWDFRIGSDTYLTLAGENLRSDGDRMLGLYEIAQGATLAAASSTREQLKFEENNLNIALNQLLGDNFSLGASYRLSDAVLRDRFVDLPEYLAFPVNQKLESTLHQLRLQARYYNRWGLFGMFETLWHCQANRGYHQTSERDRPGDDFWQLNAFLGYRFPRRRAELQLGVLNLADQNYRLNPLNFYQDLPRERTFVASLKFHF